MNKAQKFIYWLDGRSSIFKVIENKRAEWFESKFNMELWFSKKENILDIGSGVCDITKKVSNYSKGNIFGIDHEDFRRQENKFSNIFKYVIADAIHIPFYNNTFDCITLFWTLHHIRDHKNVLDEVYRVLKNNGELIILEDLIDENIKFNSFLTKIYDRVINLEISNHPGSNKSLSAWNNMIKKNYDYTNIELTEIPWFTKFNLLKFGLLRYKKSKN